MKLDRNVNQDRKGKYTLINNRTNRIEYGVVGESDEFFVIKLKDKYAQAALNAYAQAAGKDDPEWASEIYGLVGRAGENSPYCKIPD